MSKDLPPFLFFFFHYTHISRTYDLVHINEFLDPVGAPAHDPGDGEDPDPEIPDDPADLSASDELTVLINDAWEVIHNMELE